MNRKHFTILAVITVILAALALMPHKADHGGFGTHQRFFPDLEKQLNDVSRVQVQEAGRKPVTIERDGDQWKVKEAHGYPADLGVLRHELLHLARLEEVEPKTRKSAKFQRLGLRSVDDAHSAARVIRVWVGKADKPLSLLAGKSARRGSYVRREGENQSWLASDTLAPPTDTIRWVDRRVLDVDRARIREVSVAHSDGTRVVVRRNSTAKPDFQLIDIPKGRKPKSSFVLNRVAESLAVLSLEDVEPQATVHFDKPDLSATMSTFDGLRVDMDMVKEGEKTYARLHADVEKPVADAAATGKKSTANPNLKTTAEVQKEVESLNRRWSGWVYELPAFRVKNLSRTAEDLTEKD